MTSNNVKLTIHKGEKPVRIHPKGPELPFHQISYDPIGRTFSWEVKVKGRPPSLNNPTSNEGPFHLYKQLTPEEITRYIDDETMAECLAMSLTQAR
ncbi:hypothetical protein J2045_003389 [Peteryoungia aggregata LMG 23059]|uniref:Uncharacterized protein n=1 Tax=Peteryoungia aggregata LMG 23059 TaxID=1368425 RepID=A0ABU0GAF7_9HYPH|nr:hypothetical protein [Peteryoungia aggregata]MDQ0422341.1 hypothetical protein [Peteryoungia aggregata LMG 23059]